MIMKKLNICIFFIAFITNTSFGQVVYDKILHDCYNEGPAKRILFPVFVNGRLPEKSIGYISYSNSQKNDTMWFIFTGFTMSMPEKTYHTLLHIDSVETNGVFGIGLCLRNYLDYSNNDTMWIHAEISTEWIRCADPTYIRIATINKKYYLFSIEYDGREYWIYKDKQSGNMMKKVKKKYWKLYHSNDGITGILW